MEIQTTSLEHLRLDPKNPRAHPKANIEAIKASLSRFGQVLPLLVRDGDHQVVAGNGTLIAMQQLGWKECKVALHDGTDDECKALAIALNRTGELASWDEDNLGRIVTELRTSGSDVLGAVGFDTKALDDLVHMFKGTAPDFSPVDQETQPQLDQVNKMMTTCPECGHEFTPGT